MRERLEEATKRILALALSALLFLQAAPAAWAETAEADPEEPEAVEEPLAQDDRAPERQFNVVRAEELQALMDEAIQEQRLRADNISVGFCYTPTGETWYYNEGAWYYSASLYKVPLMMILAEQEHNGELTQETYINGVTLGYAEDRVLVYSNNDIAHLMLDYLGTGRECRTMYRQFSSMPEEDYTDHFYAYSYFTVRFMTDVMATLYYEQERFPHILDCLKKAQPDNWFNRTGEHEYEIAQKYGSYEEFNHTSGVIYTPNPFIFTVMTKNTAIAEENIAKLKQRFQDYTLQLDQRLELIKADYAARQEEQARLKEKEEARLAEEQRKAEESVRQENAGSPKETAAPSAPVRTSATEKRGRDAWVLLTGAAAMALGLLGGLVSLLTRPRKKRRVTVPEEESPVPPEKLRAHKPRREPKLPREPKAAPVRSPKPSRRRSGRYTPRH